MQLNRHAELQSIAEELTDPRPEGHAGALQRLIHLASSYPVMPPEVRDLLIRATGDPDPELGRLAERALYVLDGRDERRLLEPEVPERELVARSRRVDLERAAAVLAARDAVPGDRLGAVQTLVHLASLGPAAPAIANEALGQLRRVESDPDSEIARLAGRALARREGRAVDPAFARPARSRTPAGSPEEPDLFAGLAHERPTARLATLELLLETALNDDRRDDSETLEAFVRLLSDPDPRVAYRAGNALFALAGDRDALGDVYVGEAVDGPGLGELRVEASTRLAPPPGPGRLDEHGVFRGLIPGERPAGEPGQRR